MQSIRARPVEAEETVSAPPFALVDAVDEGPGEALRLLLTIPEDHFHMRVRLSEATRRNLLLSLLKHAAKQEERG